MDPITDLLNRIRNAQAVSIEIVSLPFSNLKYKIAKVLEKEGFIEKVEKKGKKTKKTIKFSLKYKENIPAISELKRVSRQGQRIYTSYKNIKRVKGGKGISIISTPKGLMTDKDARKEKVGGEVLCEIW